MVKKEKKRKLIAIDTSYTYTQITQRNLLDSIVCRDIEGFFEKVWSVHPFASYADHDHKSRYGKFDIIRISKNHIFIDGKYGRYNFLKIIC